MKIITTKAILILLLFFNCFLMFSCKKETLENKIIYDKPDSVSDSIKSLIKKKLTSLDYENIIWDITSIKKVPNSSNKIIQIPLRDNDLINSTSLAVILINNDNQYLNGEIVKIKASSYDSCGQMNGLLYKANLNRTNEESFEIHSGYIINSTPNAAAMIFPQVTISLAEWYYLLDQLGIGTGLYIGIYPFPPIVTSGGGGGSNPASIVYSYYSLYLSNLLFLNQEQKDWLNNHTNEAIDIFESIDDSRNIDLEEATINGSTFTPFESTLASKVTIAVAMANQINSPFNESHYNNYIKPNLPFPQNQVNYNPIWGIYFDIQCAILKQEHPEWSNIKVYWEASNEMIHIMLDVGGMVPVIGEVCDLANGIIYTLQGEGVNATLSFAAMIPVAGWTATIGKYAKKTIIALNGTKRTLKWGVEASGIIKFGDRSLLRKVLGLVVGDVRAAHHIIPWEHGAKELVQKAASGDFHLNEILNGIPLTAIQHSGSHFLYNSKIAAKLDFLWVQFGQGSMNIQTAEILVRNLANDIRAWIIAHPNESINNIILP